jgi:hypothetical protein
VAKSAVKRRANDAPFMIPIIVAVPPKIKIKYATADGHAAR